MNSWKPTEAELINFAESLSDSCTKERPTLLMEGQGTWDTRVRKAFAKALDGWFLNIFPTEEPRNYVYVEGSHSIPNYLRGRRFYGTTMHPDAAIIMGSERLVAIELDHGNKGSQIRNALAKASFSVLLGGYKQAMVLFFADTKSNPKLIQRTNENEVLSVYKERFKTTLFIL